MAEPPKLNQHQTISEYNKRTDDLKGLILPFTSVQDTDQALSSIANVVELEVKQKFGKPSVDLKNNIEAQTYIARRKLELTDAHYTKVVELWGRARHIPEEKIKALATQIKNVPEIRKNHMESAVIPLFLKHGQIDLSTFEDWKNRFNKHQDEIISEAIAAGIAPYKAMASLASLGVLFGGIAQMVGTATGKPEWTEFGTKTMAWSIDMAKTAKNEILALDKEQKILRNIDRTPEGFTGEMDAQQKRIAAQAHEAFREIILLTADNPELRAIMLASWAKGFEQHCAGLGIECPGVVRSVRNNNPGNLRPVGSGDGFQSFATPEAGLQAMHDDLRIKISGQSKAMASRLGAGYKPTLENLITVWAPPTHNGKKENDTAAYIARVAKETGIKPDQVLQLSDIPKLMPSMIAHEGGAEAVAYFKPTLDKMYGGVPKPAAPTPADKPKGHASAAGVITPPANQAFAHAQPAPKGVDSRDVARNADLTVTTTDPDDLTKKRRQTTPAANPPAVVVVVNAPALNLDMKG